MGGMCTGHRKKLSFLPSVAGKALEETWRRAVRVDAHWSGRQVTNRR